MNIYFACSITGGREFESVYQQIVSALEADGHDIPTSHLAQSEVMQQERIISAREVYERDTAWIVNCGALVAEVSVPSHGVGYEIAFALQAGKPVLCLHHEERRVSKMITGNPDPLISVVSYRTVEEGIDKIRAWLEQQ